MEGRAEGTLSALKSGETPRLTGYRVDAKPGDWVLRNAGMVAVVQPGGRIVDFAREGGADELVFIDPTLFFGIAPEPSQVVEARADGAQANALYMRKALSARRMVLHAWVYFVGNVLTIETAVENEGAVEQVVTLGEIVAWGNIPSWVEGYGFIKGTGSFTGAFMARESFGVSYALATAAGRITARIPSFDLPGFYDSSQTGEEVIAIAPRAVSKRRIAHLAHSTMSFGDAAMRLPTMTKNPKLRFHHRGHLPNYARIEVAGCGLANAHAHPFLEFSASGDTLVIPRGCYSARLNIRGDQPGDWVDLNREPFLQPGYSAMGQIEWSVKSSRGESLPARVLIRGVGRTPDPDFGEDPLRGAALNVVYSSTGNSATSLLSGRYRVTIDRGFEYTIFERDITVKPGKKVFVTAILRRVVDTKGWIAADLHLHAAPSPDAPARLEDRVHSLAAVGVEVGVATDHNVVTDYAPTIRDLKLEKWVASVVGNEVTTKEVLLGHFNLFPLAADSAPAEWRRTTPRAIIDAARASKPYGKDTIVQVNHPRMRDLGTFELLRLDPRDVKGWVARTPLAAMDFDAIEVFNGDHYHRSEIPKVEECLRDWYALLNAGYRHAATGNSDSHKLTYHEAGVPRNLVAVPNDDPAQFDERAFVKAIREARIVVSSGPFVTITAAGKGIGDTISAGTHEVDVRVQAPPWMDVDRVDLVKRGEVVKSWTGGFGIAALRVVRNEKLDLKRGDWIIAIARGTRPMSHLHRPDAPPFAFTNPIWVE